MSGETDLGVLLANLSPRLAGDFIFCCIAEGRVSDLPVAPVATFRENEGTTVVLEKEPAERAGMRGPVHTLITLDVHSSLDAVGMIAAVTTALADAGISVNVFAGFYHDHLFVPVSRASQAVAVLNELSARYRA